MSPNIAAYSHAAGACEQLLHNASRSSADALGSSTFESRASVRATYGFERPSIWQPVDTWLDKLRLNRTWQPFVHRVNYGAFHTRAYYEITFAERLPEVLSLIKCRILNIKTWCTHNIWQPRLWSMIYEGSWALADTLKIKDII